METGNDLSLPQIEKSNSTYKPNMTQSKKQYSFGKSMNNNHHPLDKSPGNMKMQKLMGNIHKPDFS